MSLTNRLTPRNIEQARLDRTAPCIKLMITACTRCKLKKLRKFFNDAQNFRSMDDLTAVVKLLCRGAAEKFGAFVMEDESYLFYRKGYMVFSSKDVAPQFEVLNHSEGIGSLLNFVEHYSVSPQKKENVLSDPGCSPVVAKIVSFGTHVHQLHWKIASSR